MKFLILLLACSLFIGCFAPRQKSYDDNLILAKEWIYEYYPEWGLRRVVGKSVYQNGSVSSEHEIRSLLNNDVLCYNLVTGVRGFYAERIYLNESGEVSLECLSIANNPFFYEDNGSFIYVLNNKDKTELQYKKEASLFRVTYNGAKVDLNVPQQKRDSGYEFSLPVDASFYSLIVRTDPKDLEGYKPLKLDPSILPLESPGYKKLREQEEALGRK